MTMNERALEILEWGKNNGWNEENRDKIEIAKEKLLLMHTEISEAVEELRNNNGLYQIYHKDGTKPEGFPIELADLLIRILHLFAILGIDPDMCVEVKQRYNETRTFKHGNKLF